MKFWRRPLGRKNKSSERSLAREEADAKPPFDAADADGKGSMREPPLGDFADDEEPVPPRRRRRAESAYADGVVGENGGFAGDSTAGGAARARRKTPWILRILAGLGVFCRWLGRLIWKYARKNIVLALGIALFGAIFLVVIYNAFFQQRTVSRPVLFSTRADNAARNGRRPYVEKIISTEALDREQQAIPDIMGDFVTQQVNAFDREQGQKAMAEGETDIAQVIAGAETPKLAARQAARSVPLPAPDDKLLPTRERVLKLQKALRKSGERGLDINGVWNEKTRGALRHFQKTHGLKATGEIDGAVIAKMQHMRIW